MNTIKMIIAPCSPANSVLEGDLELAVQQGTLKKLVIAEIDSGYYVTAQLKWSGSKEWYLTTRRERFQPRVFKDLRRLNDLLRESIPTDSVEILRYQKLPPKGNAKQNNHSGLTEDMTLASA